MVEVFTTTANGDSELPSSDTTEGSFEGVPVRYYPRHFPKRWFNASGLSRAIRDEVSRFDLVHVHGLWNFPGRAATRACRQSEVPYVLSTRGMLNPGSFAHHGFGKRIVFAALERRSLEGARFVHATSESEAEAVRARCPGAKVVVVPNGVAISKEPVQTSVKESGLVVFLGRLHPTKRVDLLLEAFDRVAADLPAAKLVLAGRPDGLDPGRLLRGRSQKVRWVGHLSDGEKWRLLSEASVVVQCSDSESFGMSVVEALAAGVPVVVTRTCPWEDLETHRCGHWVEQDAAQMSNAIVRVLSDPVEARRMGERGRQLVNERYSWAAIGRRMSSLYREAVGGLESAGGELRA